MSRYHCDQQTNRLVRSTKNVYKTDLYLMTLCLLSFYVKIFWYCFVKLRLFFPRWIIRLLLDTCKLKWCCTLWNKIDIWWIINNTVLILKLIYSWIFFNGIKCNKYQSNSCKFRTFLEWNVVACYQCHAIKVDFYSCYWFLSLYFSAYNVVERAKTFGFKTQMHCWDGLNPLFLCLWRLWINEMDKAKQ